MSARTTSDADRNPWKVTPVPDRVPTEWNGSTIPDSIPPSWDETRHRYAAEPWRTAEPDPATERWDSALSEPSTETWGASRTGRPDSARPVRDGRPSAVVPWSGALTRTHAGSSAATEPRVAGGPGVPPASERRRNPKLALAGALIAAALAGGGVGAGIMAVLGGDTAATAPAAPAGGAPGSAPDGQASDGRASDGQEPDGQAPTAQATQAG